MTSYSANNVEQLGTRAGYALANNQMRAPIYYDSQDTNYYADPNGTTRFYEQRNAYRLHIGDETNLYNGILVGTPINRPDLTIKGQYPQLNIMSTQINNGTHGPTLRFAAYDSAGAASGDFKHWVIGIAGTNATSLHFGYYPNQTNPHYGIGRGWSSGNNVSMFWLQNDRNVYAENDVRALRFVDRDSTGYYMDPSNLSELYDVRQRGWYTRTYAHSGSDFVNGTLVRTSIPATATNGASYVLEASGKSYSGDPPFKFTAQGYLYANTIINHSGQHIGKAGFGTLYAFENGGVLCFWWPRVSYWNSFAVHVRDAGGDDRNLVTSITNSTLPGYSKGVATTMRTTAMYNVNIGTGDMYATRYYDSNNTGYYGDFASTSRMNTIDVDRINFVGGAPAYFYTSSGALRGYIRATETNDSHFEFATSGGEDIIFRDGGFGGSWNQIIRGDGQVLIASRLDTPIMYDLDNTGYYVNPAATTQLSYVLANNWFRPQGDTGVYWESYGRGIWSPESQGNSYGNVTTYSAGRNGWQGWGIGSRHVFMSTGGDNVGIHDNSRGWIMYWNGARTRFDHGYTEAAGSFRAPIFYDVNDTGYYADPNSTTRLNRLYINPRNDNYNVGSLAGTNPVSDWQSLTNVDGQFTVAQYNAIGSYSNSPPGVYTYGAVMSWRTANHSFQLYAAHTGDLAYKTQWQNDNYSGWLTPAVYGRNAGSASGKNLYSDIMYDTNNTAYFVDPTGRSRLSSMDYGNGSYYLAGGDWGYRHNTPYGWIQFGPANTSHAHIYTDRSNFYFNVNEMYMNGRFVLNENYWINNKYFGSGGEIYGTVFYDSNNSAYYFDGASINSTRFEGVSNRTKAMMGLSGRTGFSAEYYSARPRITGDQNYWTGSMGWGVINMNDIAHWGSGFIDSWGNPPNQPSGTSHWVGTQAWHYTNNASVQYGWQMVGGPIGNLRFRQSWGGFGAWRTVPMLDVNDGNGGAMYAGIYYDSNNPAYYFDGASTSRWNESNQDGYHTFNNYGIGVTGTYDSTRLQLVFAMGSSYRPNAAGTATANMYGIGWSHPNAGGLGGANQLNDHGMLIINNGGFRAAISSRAVFASDVRTPIYYDWNDTGYYLDPNSTSNSALRIRGGTLHGPNPSWGRYLYVGTNGNVSSEACVATTDGNLHLDSRSGNNLYLQWYVGNTVFVQGAIQATIYYDRNDTSYYTDPNSTSRLVAIDTTGGTYNTFRTWTNLPGYHGIYSSVHNNAHFYPNPDSYGSWRVIGSRNGWGGLQFDNGISLMMNQTVHGFHSTSYGWRLYLDGNLYCPGNVTAYWSDRRLKENIKELERGSGLDLIYKLKPSKFNWKKEATEVTGGVIEAGKEEVSIIAQEAQEVLCDAVVINKTGKKGVVIDGEEINDYLTINYDKITPFLIQAIKDLKDEIDDLKQEMKILKGENK